MCGLVGFYSGRCSTKEQTMSWLRTMVGRLFHRGPDDEGFWSHEKLQISLAHRRLAIQDLSPYGAQPMRSQSGRYVIAFNGEIYNFQEIRRELELGGVAFRGHSDTEVMLAAIERWGLEQALGRFVGMFAFALCDCDEGMLYLVRDRMGEKPLYYGWQGGTFLFGSELGAFQPHPDWRGEINRDALSLLARHNYIPAPSTIYKDIYKLAPGALLVLDLKQGKSEPKVSRYWKLEDYYAQTGTAMERQARLDEIEALARRSVKQQMISDVPLGAFLSGGIDSSTIVALMQAQSSRPVRTFSIGFREEEFNEAEHAKAVAAHLGTDHTELYVTPEQALEVIQRLPSIYDEPFADSSQIPTVLLCELTKKHVTVSLSGDGGDELFCGYSRFMNYGSFWRRWMQTRDTIKSRVKQVPYQLPAALTSFSVKALIPSQRQLSLLSIQEKLARQLKLRASHNLQEYYRTAVSYWHEPGCLVLSSEEPESVLRDFPVQEYVQDPYKQMMLLDSLSYLPDDILVKVDRAAMSCSLETRVPFLDHRIVEYAVGIPVSENVHGQSGKLLLKELLYRYVPQHLVDRPKKGFAVLVADWLRGPLRDWGETLLDEKKLVQQGYFDTKQIKRVWSEHQSRAADHSFHLWGILSFQSWLEYQKEEKVIRGVITQ